MTGRYLGAASVLAVMTVLTAVGVTLHRDRMGDPDTVLVVAAIGFCVVGAVVIARADAVRVGSILSLIGLSLIASGILSTAPGEVETSPLVVAVGSASWWLTFGAVGLLMTLFPTGTTAGRRWRWLTPLGIGATGLMVAQSLFAERVCLTGGESGCAAWATNPIGIAGVPDPEYDTPGVLLLLLLFIVAAAVSTATRFRRSTGIERLQLKWVSLAVGGFAAFLLTGAVGDLLGLGLPDLVGTVFIGVVMLGLPVSVGVALTRHRLYDIDRVVSRTVAYTLVAAVVGLVYALPVLLLPRLLGGSNDLVVAAATLAAAAVFTPARRRIQRQVDRRFDRARYDAEREVDSLSNRLRSGATLEAVTAEVGQVVRGTIGPSTAALWIRTKP